MPFKKKAKTTKKKEVVIEEENNADENSKTGSISAFSSSVDTSFFYTNTKQLNAIDDDEIISKITAVYPEFVQTNKDTQLKKIFLNILDNETLVYSILDQYDLTIHEFFKLIFKSYSALFNTLFIKKVKDKLKQHNYAKL